VSPAHEVPSSASSSLPRSAEGFHLRRELGRGGMGIVYEAMEISTGRTVALKVLLQDLALSNEAMERFQREARLAAAISHAHCVFVYGAHKVEGAPAIAMELIGGETLEDRIRRGEAIPIETAVRWMIDVIDGLEAAHRAGVLHRDVKPSNCFVTPDDRVKVGDFGLSRSLERDIQLTQSGQFLGSPLYASPEQIRGRSLDARSDLYSVGATLYAILTGRPPFSGGNVGEVLARILSEEPPHPRSIRPAIPRALELVVLRAMEREPEKRYADLHELRQALEPFADTRTEVVAPWRRVIAYVIDTALTSILVMSVLIPAFVSLVDLQSTMGQMITSLLTMAYFAIGEGFFGWTLGKWMCGLRVVSTETHEPSLGAAALRILVFSGPTLIVTTWVNWVHRENPNQGGLWQLGFMALWLVALFSTARRRNAWRGLHELASGTVVIPVSLPFSRARFLAPPPEMELQAVAGLPERVGDYTVEGVIGATPLGTMVKARDQTLERSVWIHVPTIPGVLASDDRRSLARPGRLRWLDLVRTPAGEADVFESPGGCNLPMFSLRHGSIDWPNAQRLLLGLVEELTTEDARDRAFALEQVWIDRNWDIRLLDQAVGHGPFVPLAPVDLVREAARALFVGRGDGAPLLPLDLPVHAEPAVSQLMGLDGRFTELGAIRDALTRLSAGPTIVQRRTRGAQLALNVMVPAMSLGMIILLSLVVVMAIVDVRAVEPVIAELESGRIKVEVPAEEPKPGETATERVAAQPADGPQLTEEQHRAREIVLADAASTIFGNAFLRTPDAKRSTASKSMQVIDAALANHPKVSEEELAWARASLLAEPGPTGAWMRGERDRTGPDKHEMNTESGGLAFRREFPAIATLVCVGLWGAFAIPLAFACRGGLTFLLFGIRVRNRRGRPASRVVCTLRCFLAWAPIAVVAVALLELTQRGHMTGATVLAITCGVVWLAALVDAILNPAQCVVDRVLRTRLVPR
jgi:uncharacterized RDD family membrane protein YckC